MTTFNGTISFTITAAKKLPDTDRISFNLWENDLTDPFVEIEIDGHELFRTKHVDNCLDPVWESENTYEHKVNGEIKEILIKIKDKEAIGSVNVCGKCFDGEDLKAFAKKKTTEGWFDLRNESGKGEYLADAQVQLIMKYNHELIAQDMFYLINEEHDVVLDIANDLLVTSKKERLRESQLWKWECENSLLVNKQLGLVADAMDVTTDLFVKARPRCTEGSQKWRFSDGMITHNMSGKVLEIQALCGSPVILCDEKDEGENNLSQKWLIVPEPAWHQYESMKTNKNPLTVAHFWKTLVDDHFHHVVGFTVDEYINKVDECINTLEECANELEKVNTDTATADIVGESVGIAGGALILGGLILAPFTAGASLAAVAAGGWIGVASGVTTVTASVIEGQWEKCERKEAREAVTSAWNSTSIFSWMLNEYIESLKCASVYTETEDGSLNSASSGFATLIGFLSNPRNYLSIASSLAKYASKHVLYGVFTVVAIGFGIHAITDSAEELKNGSDLADNFRSSSNKLMKTAEEMIKIYNELQGKKKPIFPWKVGRMYLQHHDNGGYVSKPVSDNNWPCGTFLPCRSMMVLYGKDENEWDGKDIDEFSSGQYCKIQSLETTRDGYDWLFAYKTGWIYYDLPKTDCDKQIWKLCKSGSCVSFESVEWPGYYLGISGKWLTCKGKDEVWWKVIRAT